MEALGFYADISGVSSFLNQGEVGEAKVMQLIYGLGNILHEIGEFAEKENMGRLFAYQMGDGFMVHFDNVKYNQQNCRGTVDDLVDLSALLVRRFSSKEDGVLRLGLGYGEIFCMSETGFKFATSANDKRGNGYRCGRGVFFLLPITGTLLAKCYSLVTEKIDGLDSRSSRILADSGFYEQLSKPLKRRFCEMNGGKSTAWSYKLIKRPDDKESNLYKRIWPEA